MYLRPLADSTNPPTSKKKANAEPLRRFLAGQAAARPKSGASRSENETAEDVFRYMTWKPQPFRPVRS